MKRGLKLKLKRIEMGLSQDDLGAAINVSRQSISLYERGKLLPKVENMKRIAELLGADIQELFFQD